MCNNGVISLHSCSPIMTSATNLFYICSFPFSAQFILHQPVSKFVFVALKLCMMILMQSSILLIFPIFVAVGN